MPYFTPKRQKKFREALVFARELVVRAGGLLGNGDGENIISMFLAVQRDGTEKLSDEEIIQEVRKEKKNVFLYVFVTSKFCF
jgi:cytochrome P450